jgi:Cation efflux family
MVQCSSLLYTFWDMFAHVNFCCCRCFRIVLLISAVWNHGVQHVCADTLRSIAVLVAAALGALFSAALSPTQVDSVGAIVVSIIILMSLGPLLQGVYLTACKIHAIWTGHHHHDHDHHQHNNMDNVLNV